MIKIKQYSHIPIDKGEIIRYMGAGDDSRTLSLIDECLSELGNKLSFKVCYFRFQIRVDIVDIKCYYYSCVFWFNVIERPRKIPGPRVIYT